MQDWQLSLCSEGEPAGQRGSDGRAGVGPGKRTPRLGVGCTGPVGRGNSLGTVM